MALNHMWCDTLKSSYVDGSLLYMLDHRHGHWNDLGPVGRTVTLSAGGAPPFWKNSAEKGWSLSPGGSYTWAGRLAMTHTPDMLVTSATIFMALKMINPAGIVASSPVFMCKGAAGAIGLQIHVASATQIRVTVSGTAFTFNFSDWLNAKTIIATVTDKGNVELIVSGASCGILAGASLPGTNDKDVYLMNSYANTQGDPTWLYQAHALWNRVLTPTEIDNLLKGWDRQTAITKPKKNIVVPTPIIDRSLDPRLDVDMTPVAGKVIDRSAYGNHGTLVGGPTADKGVFGTGLRFDGVKDTINFGSNASVDVSGDFSVGMWHKLVWPGTQVELISKTNGAALGWHLTVVNDGTGRLDAIHYAGGFVLGTTKVDNNSWVHSGFTVKSGRCRLFVNGIQEGVGAVTTSDAPASNLWLGSYLGIADWARGILDAPFEVPSAMSPEQVLREYLKGAVKPVFVDDFSDYPVSPVALGASGQLGRWEVSSGTWQIVIDSDLVKRLKNTTAGVLYNKDQKISYGTFKIKFKITTLEANYFFILASSDYPAAPAASNMAVYVDNNGVLSVGTYGVGYNMRTAAGFIQAGVEYELSVIRRANNSTVAYIKGGTYTDYTLVTPATGTQPFTQASPAAESKCMMMFCNNNDGHYYRDVSAQLGDVRPASAPWFFGTGTYSGEMVSGIPCKVQVTAGYSFIPKDLDWRRVEFYGLHADASVTDWVLGTELGSSVATAQNAYTLRVNANERLLLVRSDNGVEVATPGQTADGFIAAGTLYQYRIERTDLGVWTVKVKGGAYADWTLAITTAPDLTHTVLNYWNEDHDAGDKSSAPKFFKEAA